jgi:hypothetical protein
MEHCNICGQQASELCPDGNCRACHKSLTFEDCCSGTWSAAVLMKAGYPLDLIKQRYPDADLDRATTLDP